MQVSDETSRRGLNIAHEEGAQYQNALRFMTEDVASGEVRRVGDYLVGYAIESAEGLYQMSDGHLDWKEPQEENIHVEVTVCDPADGRFMPGLTVHATLTDSQGHEIGRHEQPFLWHPWLYHYGRNWHIPNEGDYTLRVQVSPPAYARHDKKNGSRFVDPVDVEFSGVHMQPGRK